MLIFSFTPFPVLETDNLILRRIADTDADAIFKLRSDPETMRYVPRPLAKTIDDAREHIRMINEKIDNDNGINWAITVKGNDDFIGIIGLFRIMAENYRAELGYMLLPEYHNRGIISEAIAKMLQYGFDEMKLHSVEAIIDPENIASAKVLEKNGFRKEAHLRENEYYNGKFLDTVIYAKLRTD